MKGLLILITCMLMTTCHTIELPIEMDSKDKPVFEISGTIGNRIVSLAAGKDNFILNTSFDRLNFQVVQLTGHLKPKSCDLSCKPSLKLNLRQSNTEFINQASRAIEKGRRAFYKVDRDSILLKSTNQSVLNSSNAKLQYAWEINDRKHSTDENISIVNNGEDIKICLTVKHPDGGTASNCQIVDFNPFDSIPGLKVNIESIVVNKVQRLEAKVIGKGPFKFTWDDNKSVGPIIELDGKKNSQCVKVVDINGNMVTDCITLNPEGKIKLKSQFLIEYDKRRIHEITQFNSAEIIYIDSDGLAWSSSLKNQPSNSFFEVIDDLPYDSNDKGQPTRKLNIKMDGLMFNLKGETTNLKLAGSIGVALPPK